MIRQRLLLHGSLPSLPASEFRIRLLSAVIAASCLGESALAQEPSEPASPPRTKLETFLATKGRMVVKDFYELGMVAGSGQKLKLDAVLIYEPGREAQKLRGLRVEITELGRVERSHTSFLDIDELESFSSAVSYMAKLAGEWQSQKREPYTEVVFATRGDFQFGFFQKGTDQKTFASSGVVGRASFYGDLEDLPRLKTLLDEAQAKLKAQ